MTMNRASLLLILCLMPMLAVAANDPTVAGPVSGFVFDSSAGALRPVVGVPGAAYLGDAMVSGLTLAAPSPDGSSALAVREGQLALLSGLKSTMEWNAIEGVIDGVDLIAWSPDGNIAAVYASGTARVQVLRSMTKSPAAAEALAVAGHVISLAVDNAGNIAAAVEASGVFRIGSDGAVMVAPAAKPVGLAFAPGGDLFFADQDGSEVWQVANFARDAAAMSFAAGLGTPVGLQISPDGSRLFAADAGNQNVVVYDVAARAASGTMALDTAPALLAPLGSTSLWLLNGPAGNQDPLYVLDGSVSPAVYFVPAGRDQ